MTTQPTPAGSEAVSETLPPLEIGEPTAPPQPQEDKTPGKPDAAAAPEGEAENQDSEQEDKGEGKKRNNVPFKVRIAQITGARRVAEARAESLAEELAEANRRLSEYEQRRSEMSFDEQEDARLRAALDRRDAERSQRQIQATEQQIHENRQQLFRAKIDAAADRLPTDFIEQFAQVPVTPVMGELIAESDRAAEMAHYLTKNKAVASELAQLTDPRNLQRMPSVQAANAAARAAKIFGAIEASLKPAASLKATRAPAPGTVLNGGSPPPARSLEEEDDMDAYSSRRRESWRKGGK